MIKKYLCILSVLSVLLSCFYLTATAHDFKIEYIDPEPIYKAESIELDKGDVKEVIIKDKEVEEPTMAEPKEEGILYEMQSLPLQITLKGGWGFGPTDNEYFNYHFEKAQQYMAEISFGYGIAGTDEGGVCIGFNSLGLSADLLIRYTADYFARKDSSTTSLRHSTSFEDALKSETLAKDFERGYTLSHALNFGLKLGFLLFNENALFLNYYWLGGMGLRTFAGKISFDSFLGMGIEFGYGPVGIFIEGNAGWASVKVRGIDSNEQKIRVNDYRLLVGALCRL